MDSIKNKFAAQRTYRLCVPAVFRAFPEVDLIRLHKSYRSTVQITSFAQRISPNLDFIAIERHGKEPVVIPHKGKADEFETLRKLISAFKQGDHRSMAIICKMP